MKKREDVGKMCTIWRLQTKTEDSNGRVQHIGDYCIKYKVAAMGWSLKHSNDTVIPQSDRESIGSNFDMYVKFANTYPDYKYNAVKRLATEVNENDIIWMRDKGLYYISRVGKDSKWRFNASKEAEDRDASNQRNIIEWHLAGDEGDISGVINTAFIQGSTFQRILAEGARLFSCSLYNKLSEKNHYTNLYESINEVKFYNCLSPSDAEDLLCFWLYEKHKYIAIPSTNKSSTQLYECVLLDTRNGKKVFIQVKKGENRIDARDYAELSKHGEVYLLQTNGGYDYKDSVNIDSESYEIHFVEPKVLFDFAKDKQNSNALSPSINKWVEFLFAHDNKE